VGIGGGRGGRGDMPGGWVGRSDSVPHDQGSSQQTQCVQLRMTYPSWILRLFPCFEDLERGVCRICCPQNLVEGKSHKQQESGKGEAYEQDTVAANQR
jgi:hypothetical protein